MIWAVVAYTFSPTTHSGGRGREIIDKLSPKLNIINMNMKDEKTEEEKKRLDVLTRI